MLDVCALDQKDWLPFFTLASEAFEQGVEPTVAAQRWTDFFASSPSFHPRQLRGVYDGDNFLGGCIIHEREMRVGPATAPTACIGAVVTRPEQRGKGVGRALLEACTEYARAGGFALLFLDGIPDFYNRFGYTDVWAPSFASMRIEAIDALPASPYQIVEASAQHAPDMLELYNRHFGGCVGSFHWRRQDIAHAMQHRQIYQRRHLALDGDGRARGYLVTGRDDPHYAREVVADDWPATLALLKAHAVLSRASACDAAELNWPLPLNGDLHCRLLDHIRIRLQATFTPNSYWMARPAHLPTLFQRLLPVWQARWRSGLASWSGEIKLSVDGVSSLLCFQNGDLNLGQNQGEGAIPVRLTSQTLTQLIFGYRPLSWYAAEAQADSIPARALPVLSILFPTGHAFVPGTDHF